MKKRLHPCRQTAHQGELQPFNAPAGLRLVNAANEEQKMHLAGVINTNSIYSSTTLKD